MKYDLTYLSLGAGIQSSAMLLCAEKGLYNVPRPSICYFADTKAEPPWVYEWLDRLRDLSSVPIKTISAGDLTADTLNGVPRADGSIDDFVTLPVYGRNPDDSVSLLRRECTGLYKIDIIRKEVRTHLGYKPRQHVKEKVRALIGISLEEAMRMKPSRHKWTENCYPLVDARLTRARCYELLGDHGWSVDGLPKRSACTFCPFHSEREWKDLKKHPELWAEIVAFDEAIRNKSRSGADLPIFLHRSGKPIAEVDFTSPQMEFDFMGDECEGMCGC